MSRWRSDDTQQKAVRDAVIGPGLYCGYSMDGRYVCLDKGQLATRLQKQYAVDTVMQGRRGDAVFIEEKIVRWPGYAYSALTLETKSCTVPGFESDGWMVYGKADWLNYAMCQADGNVLCYLIKFQELKTAFWKAIEDKPYLFTKTKTKQHNRTECCVVPLCWIEVNVGIFPPAGKLLHATPEGAEIVRAYNTGHYKNEVGA